MAHALQLKKNSAGQVTSAFNSQSPGPTPNWIKRCIVRIKAKRQVNKIMRSLNEAEEIHAGKRPGITFEDFLKDF